MKMRRNEIISQSQNCFDQSGYTGRCFKMPDIGFNRTEEERPIRATVLAQCRDHRVYFNRVTQRCTGAMSSDVGNIRSIHSSICQSRANDCCLRRATGDCQATAAPILIDGGTADDCMDMISIRNSIRQALKYDDAATFAASKEIRRFIESFAKSVRSEHARFAQCQG